MCLRASAALVSGGSGQCCCACLVSIPTTFPRHRVNPRPPADTSRDQRSTFMPSMDCHPPTPLVASPFPSFASCTSDEGRGGWLQPGLILLPAQATRHHPSPHPMPDFYGYHAIIGTPGTHPPWQRLACHSGCGRLAVRPYCSGVFSWRFPGSTSAFTTWPTWSPGSSWDWCLPTPLFILVPSLIVSCSWSVAVVGR